MIKLPSLNDQQKCFKLTAAITAIFRYKQLITIVQTTITSQNLMQSFEIIHHDNNTKFERPRKMCLATLSDHSHFFK